MTLSRLTHNWLPSVPSIFDRFFDGDLMDWSNSNYSENNATLPTVNVQETDNAFLIDVAAPGLKKKDFQVNYDNGQLIISSEKKAEKKNDKNKMIRHEFCYQSFRRTFTIAEHLVNTDKISANYDAGILHITLPKRDEAKPKPAKQIQIS